MAKKDERTFITSGEAAELLGVSGSRVRELISKGRLQATPVGRLLLIDRADALAISKAPKIAAGRPSHQLRRPSMRAGYRSLRQCFTSCNLWLHGETAHERLAGERGARKAMQHGLKVAGLNNPLSEDIKAINENVKNGEPNAAIAKMESLNIDYLHRKSKVLLNIKINIQQVLWRFESDPTDSPAMRSMATGLRMAAGRLQDLVGVIGAEAEPTIPGQLSRETVEHLLCLSRQCGFLPVKSALPYERALAAFDAAGITDGDRQVPDEDASVHPMLMG
jgi:excisionase family DNA binding protein